MLGRSYNFRWVVMEGLVRQSYFTKDMPKVKNIPSRGTSDPKALRQESVYISEKAKKGQHGWNRVNDGKSRMPAGAW